MVQSTRVIPLDIPLYLGDTEPMTKSRYESVPASSLRKGERFKFIVNYSHNDSNQVYQVIEDPRLSSSLTLPCMNTFTQHTFPHHVVDADLLVLKEIPEPTFERIIAAYLVSGDRFKTTTDDKTVYTVTGPRSVSPRPGRISIPISWSTQDGSIMGDGTMADYAPDRTFIVYREVRQRDRRDDERPLYASRNDSPDYWKRRFDEKVVECEAAKIERNKAIAKAGKLQIEIDGLQSLRDSLYSPLNSTPDVLDLLIANLQRIRSRLENHR
jgi:hypothetical protein